MQAFEDTWAWDQKAAAEYNALRMSSVKMNTLMECLEKLVGTNDLLAYLVMMSSRLTQCHRVLKRTGSLYLHCDQTAAHYLKIVMDSIFGPQNFLNNIVWLYGLGGSSARYWPRKHDDLLFYSKSPDEHYFVAARVPAKSQMMAGLDKKAPDWWEIPSLNNMAKERLGYPTQKPLELLERVVTASCPPGGVVLDPFCGCGTTVHAAQFLGRRWIGIDIAYIAVDLIQKRLTAAFPSVDYRVRGIPTDLESAQKLAEANKFDFERWAVSLVGCMPNAKQVGDQGIDGRGMFPITDKRNGQLIVSVKGGQMVNPANVREVAGTALAVGAELAMLVTLVQPSAKMREAAASHGVYVDPLTHREFPKVQVYSIEDHFKGVAPKLPTLHLAYIKARSAGADQLKLL